VKVRIRGRIREVPDSGSQPPPWIGRQLRQDRPGWLIGFRQHCRGVSCGNETLEQVDVTRRVEICEQLLPQAFDIHLEQVENSQRRTQVVGGQRLRPLAQALEQHLLVADGA